MTRHVPCLVAVALALPVLSTADMAEVKKRGILRVIALKSEAPEMFRFDSGGEPGFEREMIAGFAKMHGLTLEPVQSPTTEARIPLLRRGKADVIIGIVDTESRRRQVAFTSEVLPAQHLVVTHEPHPVVTTVEAFRKEKIGLVRGSSWAQAAFDAGAPRARTRLFPDRTDVFEALQAGTVTATAMTTTDFLLAARLYPGLQGGVALGEARRASWGVRKQDAELLAALDDYIANFRAGPSWSRLVVKYFGDQALRALGRDK
jgi:ABC-type amino acid transport substrate-binding protein